MCAIISSYRPFSLSSRLCDQISSQDKPKTLFQLARTVAAVVLPILALIPTFLAEIALTATLQACKWVGKVFTPLLCRKKLTPAESSLSLFPQKYPLQNSEIDNFKQAIRMGLDFYPPDMQEAIRRAIGDPEQEEDVALDLPLWSAKAFIIFPFLHMASSHQLSLPSGAFQTLTEEFVRLPAEEKLAICRRLLIPAEHNAIITTTRSAEYSEMDLAIARDKGMPSALIQALEAAAEAAREEVEVRRLEPLNVGKIQRTEEATRVALERLITLRAQFPVESRTLISERRNTVSTAGGAAAMAAEPFAAPPTPRIAGLSLEASRIFQAIQDAAFELTQDPIYIQQVYQPAAIQIRQGG